MRSRLGARRQLAVVVLAVLIAGCSEDRRSATEPLSPPPHAIGSSAPAVSPRAGCRVFLPASVTRSLRSQWTRPRPGPIQPFVNSGPGPWIAGMVTSDAFHGVALVNLDTDEVRPIDRLTGPEAWADGGYDGVAAVWAEYHSAYGGDFVIKSWDRTSGQVRVVARTDPDARPGTVTASAPVLGSGYAAWVEGVIKRRARLVELDLSTGRTTVVATGHPTAALILGHRLVWRGGVPDGPFTTRAKTLDGRPADPPPALAAHTESLVPVSDGRAIAWTEGDGDHNELYYSPDGVQPARLILRSAPGGFNLVVLGDMVVTDTQEGLVVIRSDGTWSTLIAGGGGGAYVGAGGFLVAEPNLKKTRVPPSGLALLTPRALDLPPCD